jgi:hypothetical protein
MIAVESPVGGGSIASESPFCGGSTAVTGGIPFALHPNEIVCGWCNGTCERETSRLRSKLSARFMCNQRNYTHVKITRLLGSVKSIQMWSEEDRAEFFKKTKGRSSADLKAVHASMQSKYERHEEYYDEGGDFLPLTAWAVKGHVLKRFFYRILLGSMGLAAVGVPIVSGGAVHLLYGRLRFLVADAVGHQAGLDWRGHASIRPCFKHSNVFSKSCDMVGRIANCVDVTCEGATKFIACKAACDDNLATRKKVRKAVLDKLDKLVASSPGDEVVSNKDESEKKSSSSSDSSSSSTSRKKRHKGKKNKKGNSSTKERKRNKSKKHAAKNNERLKKENKEAKEQQKGAEQAKKAEEKQQNLKMTTANQIIAKVTPVMASLRNTLIVARASNVEDAVMVPSRQELAKLEEMLQHANMVKLDVSKPLPVERAKDRQCYDVDIGGGWGRCHAEHSSCPFS